jgi:hypothetical protein
MDLGERSWINHRLQPRGPSNSPRLASSALGYGRGQAQFLCTEPATLRDAPHAVATVGWASVPEYTLSDAGIGAGWALANA